MSFGKYATDYQERVNMSRLNRERVEKAKAEINKDGLGAMILYEYHNIRYVTGHFFGQYSRGGYSFYAVLPRNGEPTLFATGCYMSKIRDEWSTWLGGRVKPAVNIGRVKLLGAATDVYFDPIKSLLAEYGVLNEPIGIDKPLGCDEEFKKAGINLVPAEGTMARARAIKTKDEIELHRIAALNSEAAFADIQDAIRPGVRECDLMAVGANAIWRQGGEPITFNVCSGEHTNPNSRLITDKPIRPGEIIFIDACATYQGYFTCYYRTFSCGQPNERQKEMYQECYEMLSNGMKKIKAGVSTADIALALPSYEYWGKKGEVSPPFSSDWECSEAAVGHGIGLSLHFDLPWIHRTVSLAKPTKLEEGMVIAMETWTGRLNPAEGARLEDFVAVTKDGYDLLSHYPIKEISAGWR